MSRRIITVADEQAQIANIPANKGINERGMSTAPPVQAVPQADDYSSRLVKYVPAEIITAFVTMNGMVASQPDDKQWLQWAVFGFLLIATPLYTNYVTRAPGMPPATKQIAVSTVAFVLWVFAIGGPFASQTEWYAPIYGSLVLPAFTFLVPLLDKTGAEQLGAN